ncbi:MAG: hypothetical protein AAFY88_00500 [Acidobacteriota bacterium]
MKFKTRLNLFRAATVLTIALVGAAAATAQESIVIRYAPPAGVSTSTLALDMELDSSGRASGGLGALHHVTLKRGVVEALPGGATVARYEAQALPQSPPGASLESDISLVFEQSAQSAGTPFIAEVHVDAAAPASGGGGNGGNGGGGDIILWDVVGVASPPSADMLELRIAPQSQTERLRGEPAALFNSPLPGEDLVLDLPALTPGSTFEVELIVTGSENTGTRIPIVIKHTN